MKFIDRLLDVVFWPFMLFMLWCMCACSTDQAQRFGRAWSVSYTDGSGSFDSHGGFKSDEDVSRGRMSGSSDFYAVTTTFDLGEAFFPDPDVVAMRTALERALRARDAAPDPNVVPVSAIVQRPAKVFCEPDGSTAPLQFVAPTTPLDPPPIVQEAPETPWWSWRATAIGLGVLFFVALAYRYRTPRRAPTDSSKPPARKIP